MNIDNLKILQLYTALLSMVDSTWNRGSLEKKVQACRLGLQMSSYSKELIDRESHIATMRTADKACCLLLRHSNRSPISQSSSQWSTPQHAVENATHPRNQYRYLPASPERQSLRSTIHRSHHQFALCEQSSHCPLRTFQSHQDLFFTKRTKHSRYVLHLF